jgi:O-antigen ligase
LGSLSRRFQRSHQGIVDAGGYAGRVQGWSVSVLWDITRKCHMKMPEMMTNTRASCGSSPRFTKINRGDVAWLSLFVVVGSLAILYPFVALGGLAGAVALGFCNLALVHLRRAGLELWQVLLLITLSGYMLLNYGFENLTIHVGGFPIIISYVLMYAALTLAIASRHQLLITALKEPTMCCLSALILFALFHLVVDIPSYGLWAIRDASMFLDGMFLLLGLFWAMRRNSSVPLMKWLMVIFVLNLFYAFTLPWGEKLWSWSPLSGVFLQVPLLGNYRGNAEVLTSGAVFCICLGGYMVKRPRWMMLFLAMVQLLGLAIEQTRRMYVGIVIVLLLLVLLGEVKKFSRLFFMLSSGIMVVFLLTAVGGLEISGRIGPVNMAFFKEHIRSISGAEGTPGSSVQSRFDWTDEALEHFRAHPVLGEGFGRPLLNYVDEDNGAVVRMPHNSSLTILARLGAIGFALWIAFHLCLMKRFVCTFRQRRSCDKLVYSFILWFFLFYVLFMVASFVEGPLEYPAAAIPFYFLTGFALGLMRWHLPQEANGSRSNHRALTAHSPSPAIIQ